MMPDKSSKAGRSVEFLLVEDNTGDIRLTKEAFTDAHLTNTLHVVSTADEALDVIHQRGDHESTPLPDVILLDWNLLHATGAKVLGEMANDNDLNHIHVIILSGSEVYEDAIEPYSSQVDACLMKPVDPDDLIDAIRSSTDFWWSVVWPPSTAEDTDRH